MHTMCVPFPSEQDPNVDPGDNGDDKGGDQGDGNDDDDSDPGDDGPGAGGDFHRDVVEQNRAVKLSSAGLEKKTSKKSALNVVSKITGDRKKYAAMIFIAMATQPVEVEHSNTVKDSHDGSSWVSWCATMAAGTLPYLDRVAGTCNDVAVLRRMGLIEGERSEKPAFFISRADSMAIAEVSISYVRELLAWEVGFNQMWHGTLPGRFAALLSDEGEEKQDALEFCRRSWERLEELEKEGTEHRATVEALLWPLGVWPREVLVGLAEEDFQKVPADLGWELFGAFSYGGTDINEVLFNYTRRVQRLQLAGSLGLQRQWHRSVFGGHLKAMGITEIEAEDRDRGDQTEHMPEAIFKARMCEFSMGEKKLETFMDTKQGPSPNPEHLMLLPQLHHAMLSFGGDGLSDIWYP